MRFYHCIKFEENWLFSPENKQNKTELLYYLNGSVTVKMNVPGATHVGGLVGTGLYYYGEETAFRITNCTVNGEIIGAVTPGAVAGRAENSIIETQKPSN